MKKRTKATTGVTENKPAYLTKRVLLTRAKAAGKAAAASAMKLMGYVIVAEDGWIVRKNADGTVHRLKKIKTHNAQEKLVFD